jgi:hypothetical protein
MRPPGVQTRHEQGQHEVGFVTRLGQGQRHAQGRRFFFGGLMCRPNGLRRTGLDVVPQVHAVDMKAAHMGGSQVAVQKRRQGEQGHEDDHDPLPNACDDRIFVHPSIVIGGSADSAQCLVQLVRLLRPVVVLGQRLSQKTRL